MGIQVPVLILLRATSSLLLSLYELFQSPRFGLIFIEVMGFWTFLLILVPLILLGANDFPFYYRIKLFYIKRQSKKKEKKICSFLGCFISQLITNDVDMARDPFKNYRFVLDTA